MKFPTRQRAARIAAAIIALTIADLAVGRWIPYDRPGATENGSVPVVDSPSRVRQFQPGAEFIEDGATTRINALGFRDAERAAERGPDVTRILVVGDAFVEGGGEAQGRTIPARLESRLVNSLGESVEVWNCGLRSGSPAMYRWWAPMLADLSPDAVVLAVSDSDLDDDRRALVTPAFYRTRMWHALPAPFRHSAILTRLTGGVAALRCRALRLRLARRLGPEAMAPASTGPDADVGEDVLLHLADSERAAADWERTRRFLNDAVEALERRGVPTLVVHIPARRTVPNVPGDAADEAPAPDTPAFRHNLFADWLAGWSTVSGTPFLDLAPLVSGWYRAPGNAPLYQAGGRLNAAGLDKAAEWIEPEIESLLLVHTARRARMRIAP